MLSDPDKRERYDRLGANWRQQEQEAPDANFEEFFARQGFGGDDARVEFSDDLFERLFGGRCRRRPGLAHRRAAARPRPRGAARAVAGGRAGGRAPQADARSPGDRRQLPRRSARRPVDSPGRTGRTGSRRRSARRPLPPDRAQAPPELPPARRRRPRRRPSGGSVAGGARCDRPGPDPERHRPGPGARRLLQRAAPAAPWAGAAEVRGRQRRSPRDRQDHRSQAAVRP